MRIAVILMILGILQARATDAYSQKTKLSLSFSETELVKVLDKIESESDFFFLYNEKLLDTERKVSIDAKDQLVSVILDKLFTGTDVQYTIIDRKIILAPGYLTETLQQKQITGTVKGKDGSPLPGVNIVITGTTMGVISDISGKFRIDVPQEAKNLTFSFIGMVSQVINIGTLSQIDVTMAESAIGLDEVVVVGYGTVKRKDLTGAVSSVNSETLKEFSVARADMALVGKVAGVQITQSSGGPGDAPLIRIRGIGSISAGASPLYVIDGVPGGSIESVVPADIETVDVLKDASASAIYGSRGANGVIIINTKRGKAGATRISFDTHYGLQQVSRRPEYLNAKQQAEYAYYSQRNSNLKNKNDVSGDPTTWKIPVPQPFMDVINDLNTTDNDLLDYIFRTAPEQEYQLNVSGGSEKFKYSISTDYLNQEGIIINSDFKRYSVRANFDVNVSKKLDISINLNPSYTTKNIVPSAGTGAGQGEQTTAQAVAWISSFPAYNPDGSYYIIDQAVSMTVWHPVAVAKEITNKQRTSMTYGNATITYRILDDLKLRILGGVSIDNSEHLKFTPQIPAFINNVATGLEENDHGINWISENTLDYNKTFGKHSVSALVGFTAQKDWGLSSSLTSTKYPNNLVPTLNAVSGILTGGRSSVSEWSILSYLGRINYSFNNKYYVTASYRTDGSSRFGTNNKWGVFPSAALAWRISEEALLKDVSLISDIKLRASYGRTGNNNIGDYRHLATIIYNRYPFGGVQNGGYAQAEIANPNLTWETQSQYDFGIDISLLDQRLSFTLDYFHSINSDLLLNVNVPSTTGFNSTMRNTGKVKNEGWEFTTSTLNTKGKFKWTTDFNISTYKNEVLQLGPTGDPIYVGANVTQIGQPIGMFYGWISDGIFLNQEELDKGPIYGGSTSNASQMGDVRWKDISGPGGAPDGLIDTYDRTIMGSPYPDFYYSMTNHFAFMNFSLNISLQGSYGNDIFSEARVGAANGRGTRVRMMSFMANYWKSPEEPGDGQKNSFRPNDSATGNNRGAYNDRYLDTGTFLRVNNITLGYLLPSQIASKLMLRSCRIYVSSSNPITISKNTSFNPEVSARDSNLQPGNDLNDFPIPKSIMVGVNVEF